MRDLQSFERAGDHAFSTTKGVKPISGTTLSGCAAQVVGDSIEGFQLKRVRSGVETLLAANRISREIRGHVQSHGLTGIQARHYDGHDYMLEKRDALDVLAGELTGGAARRKGHQAEAQSGFADSACAALTRPAPPDRLALTPMRPRTTIAFDYAAFVGDLKTRIASTRLNAARAVNSELAGVYWDIGAAIREMQAVQGWGDGVVERLSSDLKGSSPARLASRPSTCGACASCTRPTRRRTFLHNL